MWVRKPCWLTAGLVAPPNMPGSFQVFQLQELFVLHLRWSLAHLILK